jgi:hypothetical protein
MSDTNFTDYILFLTTWILSRIKILKESQNVERKWGVKIQVSEMLRISYTEAEITET